MPDVSFDCDFVITAVGELREKLSDAVNAGATSIRLGDDIDLDTAGAQLLACALVESRSRDAALTVSIPENSAAARHWRLLSLDQLPETRFSGGGA